MAINKITCMNIVLEKTRRLEDIQNDFNNAFPFLKLEFNIPTRINNKQNNSQGLGNTLNLTIGDLNKNIVPGYLEVTDVMTVFELEKLFTNKVELPVRVLRKSGNIWMGTSITNNWTLGQQNEHGKEISSSRQF